MTGDLVRYDAQSSLDLAPQAWGLAERIAQTDFVPPALRGKPEAVLACILAGHEAGVSPMQALAKIHVIEGRPAMSAELMRAIVLRAGHEIWLEESSSTKAVACGKRAGRIRTSRVEWTMDDAKRAQLDQRQNWRKFPRAMLAARATAELCRSLFPDVLADRYATDPERADHVLRHLVAAPADAPPLVRLQGATYATAIAEHFRDQGRHVLLLMDSLTRYAMAQREIALAIGEPPATKGYPPSVFAKLPALVERSGNGLQGNGSITAFYTVLTEGDDPQDPIADAARGILDGHIVLSRELAEAGHFPAIDVEKSISRVMGSVADRGHVAAARRARQMLARYNKARDLIQLGAYTPGHDAELDLAVKLHPPLTAMLQQDMHDRATLPASLKQLATLVPNA